MLEIIVAQNYLALINAKLVLKVFVVFVREEMKTKTFKLVSVIPVILPLQITFVNSIVQYKELIKFGTMEPANVTVNKVIMTI